MWNGDPNNEGGWGKYIAVPIAVNYWAIQNRCTHEITDTIASIDSLSNHTIISHKYVNGINRNEVWLYEIKGGKHSWGRKRLEYKRAYLAIFQQIRPLGYTKTI